MSDIEDLQYDFEQVIEHNIELQEKVATLESHNRDLLAANQVMREALEIAVEYQQEACQYFHDAMAGYKEHEHERYRDDLKETRAALAIKPGDIALVEVGYASEPSIQNLINGNDVIVGKKNDIRTEAVYTIQTKSNTEQRMI